MKHLCQLSLSHPEAPEGRNECSSGRLPDTGDGGPHLLTPLIVAESLLPAGASDLEHYWQMVEACLALRLFINGCWLSMLGTNDMVRGDLQSIKHDCVTLRVMVKVRGPRWWSLS